MNLNSYKYININNTSIAYTDTGSGQPILFIHGFASFSFTWVEMIGYMPNNFRFLTLDLKGHGYSEKKCDDHLSPFDHAVIVSKFIEQLDLNDLVIVGHSLGGAISIIALFDNNIKSRVSKLVLLDSAGLFHRLPEFINVMLSISPNNPLVKMVNENLLASMVLRQIFFDKSKINDARIHEYGNILKQENAKECLFAAAKQIAIANLQLFHDKIRAVSIVPTMIIWGEKDEIIELEDAYLFWGDLRGELRIIPDCGHSPQEEAPRETAKLITAFLGADFIEHSEKRISDKKTEIQNLKHDIEKKKDNLHSSIDHLIQASGDYIKKIKMRNLFDRWSISAFILLFFIKLLQCLKKLGFAAEESGWRKASGIFLRHEHSKFILTSFRLNYLSQANQTIENPQTAKMLLVNRLADFLRKNPAYHWALDWGLFIVRRKKLVVTDIINAEFSRDGILLKLTPHFDNTRPAFTLLTDKIIQDVLKQIVDIYNKLKRVNDRKKSWILYKKLCRWINKKKDISYTKKRELYSLIERILNGTFIHFEVLTRDRFSLTANRLAIPNMKNRRHPGFGLLNIVCRFTADYKEADLWIQYHHVPVDGTPMQEMLELLKKEWGSIGQIKYPALSSDAAKPEIFYFGNKIYRARIYVSFEKLIQLRKHLNDNYYREMCGPATFASLIIWGLAQQKYFSDRKFVFPLDTALIKNYPQERSLGLIFIRPSKFFNKKNPLNGFMRFQREFNQRLFATRIGKSESYEVLELFAIVHPVFYHVTRFLMPRAFREVLGTVGVTVIKNADMCVSPLTDLTLNGFVALGNMKMPTEDGKTAGIVNICGARKQIKEYINAFCHLAEFFPDDLGIKL